MKTIGCQNNSRIRMAIGCVAIVSIVSPLKGDDVPDRVDRLERHQRIAEMSVVERNQLQKKWDAFLAMPQEEQDAYRRMHHEIESDAKQGGTLHRVLRNYHTWLHSLSPWQRAEIRAESDPQARLQLIQRFKDQQSQEQPLLDEPGYPPDRNGPSGRGRPRTEHFGMKLSLEDLDGVMKKIELSLSEPDRNQLDSLPKVQRFVRVLTMALRTEPGSETSSLHQRWPSAEMQEQMVNAITDESVRNRLRDTKHSPEQSRRMMGQLVTRALLREARNELKPHMPSEEEMRRFFHNLGEGERKQFLKQRGRGKKERLMFRYLEEIDNPLARDLAELRRVIEENSLHRNRAGRNDHDRFPRPADRGRRRFPGRNRPQGFRLEEGPNSGDRRRGPSRRQIDGNKQ